MSKKIFAVAGLLFASSFALGVALLAPSDRPASAAVSQAVPASEPAPAVITVPTVLIVADAPKKAPKPRPVSARPQKRGGLVDCVNAKVRTYETTALGTGVTYCHN